jgi:hypothetical protein
MHKDWQRDLVQRYAPLLARSALPSVGKGWRDLVERVLQRTATAMAREPAEAWLRIVRIKEEYGAIRFHYDATHLSAAATQAVQEAIDLAEARSACSCEMCGEEGRLYESAGGYRKRCGRHGEGRPLPVRPGWENEYIVDIVDEGRLRAASCRRYDRKSDAFAEIPVPDEQADS